MSRRLIVLALVLALMTVFMVQPAAAQSASWNAQYYNNSTLDGNPAVTRTENAIAFNWGQGSPAGGVNPDGFSARFTTDVSFAPGTYRFFMLADDQARVTVNFNPLPLINTLGQSRIGQVISADIQLNGPTHIQIDYVELSSDAYLYLSWANAATNPTGPNFAAPVNIPVGSGPWTVQYYGNINFAGDPTAILTTSNPGGNWGGGSPLPTVPNDNWSARWTSTQNLNAGQYTLTVSADDGVRVTVNGATVINQLGTSTGQTYTIPLTLVQGNNNFVVEFVEFGGDAFLNYSLTQPTTNLATPVPQAITGPSLTVTGAFRLNVRATPDVAGAVLTRINRNETYPVVGRNAQSSWFQINVNGTVGWVAARFVTTFNAAAVPVVGAAPAPAPGQGGGQATGQITVTASPYTVNLRQGPGTNFGRIARIPAGSTAALVGRNAANQWYQVNYNGIVGWVSAEFVVLSSGANVNSVPVTG
jgi:uncharacterized protein YraI